MQKQNIKKMECQKMECRKNGISKKWNVAKMEY